MKNSALRVGVIGASARASWAKDSHIPAIAHLDGLELSAVATSHLESARAAAQEFGAPHAFGDGLELARSSDVDVVAVCVKVPAHYDFVMAALEAGKHVYCEWPLGVDLEQAQKLRDAAEKSGVHVAIGLQSLYNPAARQAKALIEGGALGRLLRARVFACSGGWGPEVPPPYLYLEDAAQGATLTTIMGGHTLALAEFLLGELGQIAALTTTKFPEIKNAESGESVARTIPDNLNILARSQNGCALNAEVDGNHPTGKPFRFEIVGTQGKLELTGGFPNGFQAGNFELHTDSPVDPIAPVVSGEVPAPAINIAALYAALAADISNDTRTVPDFSAAVRLTHLLDTILQSGQRLAIAGE